MASIEVENVWKRFRIPHEKRATVLDHIANTVSSLGGRRYSYEEFWALKKISFRLEDGESLGIIGRNGSGKSTLLKIIARIMKPDEGRIRRNGTLAAILELGIGFHEDLSVKDNALVYGVLMGLSRSDIKRRLDSVIEFAELTRFQDVKLKHLSSGMQVRLAFSIAIQTEADIFLVDEALAVGDIEFQDKCLKKFSEFRQKGKSIVVVSHNMNLIKNYSDKALYLVGGEVKAFGPSEETANQYIIDAKSPTML